MRDGLTFLIFIGAIIAGVLAYNGVFYTTGYDWYHACWQYRAESQKSNKPMAPDPETDRLWKACEPSALKAFFEDGLIFAGLPENNADKEGFELQEACPSSWHDVPVGGFYILAIDAVQEAGGAKLLDRIFPADEMLTRAYKRKWPNCSMTRLIQGYSTIKETSPGKFGWSEPCEKCK